MNTAKVFDLSEMVGKNFNKIRVCGEKEIHFVSKSGEVYRFFHSQDCCEEVYIEDIIGDLNDLVGAPLMQAEAVNNFERGQNEEDHITWTFYKFATIKGSVTIRWFGSSNGCYSEEVDCELLYIDENAIFNNYRPATKIIQYR